MLLVSKKYCILFLLMVSICLKAQVQGKEAWHWQFGYRCALDFSSGIPVFGTASLTTDEGSASISDQNTGQLLFYTDGVVAFDRNNDSMPNGKGLLGSFTSTQSALIVPKPGSSNLYYLISCDQGGY